MSTPGKIGCDEKENNYYLKSIIFQALFYYL